MACLRGQMLTELSWPFAEHAGNGGGLEGSMGYNGCIWSAPAADRTTFKRFLGKLFFKKKNKPNFLVHLQTSQQLATVTVESSNKQLGFFFGIRQFLPVTLVTTALWSLSVDRGDGLLASCRWRTEKQMSVFPLLQRNNCRICSFSSLT